MPEVRDGTAEEWWRIVHEAEGVTFFHTPAWFEVVATATGAEPRLLLLEGPGGASAIPVAESRMRLGLRVVRSPLGVGAGVPLVVGPDPPDPAPLFAALRGARTVSAECALPAGDARAAPDGFVEEEDMTHVVDLSAGPPTWEGSAFATHRRNLRKAERAGVSVERADGREALDAVWRMYLDSRDRWGARAIGETSRDALEAATLHEAARPHVEFWMAKREGRYLSSALILTWGRHATLWIGVSFREGLAHAPNNLLHAAIMTDLAGRGVRAYDLGSSTGLDSVRAFKESIGGVYRPVRILRWRNPVLQPLVEAKRRAAGALAKKPPTTTGPAPA